MNIKQVIVIIHTNAGPKLLTLLPFLCHELYSGNVSINVLTVNH